MTAGEEALADMIERIFNKVEEVLTGYYTCLDGDLNDRAHCLVELYDDIVVTLRNFMNLIISEREESIELVLILLDGYYQCRLNQ